MQIDERDSKESPEIKKEKNNSQQQPPANPIIEEITIEELSVDGICGIY